MRAVVTVAALVASYTTAYALPVLSSVFRPAPAAEMDLGLAGIVMVGAAAFLIARRRRA